MINDLTILGNVGGDPDVHVINENKTVAKFSLATSKSYKKNGEKITETQWHNCVCWSPLAEVVEKYVKKGSKLYIRGEVQYRTYDDKEGNKKYITEINCHRLQMLDSKPKADDIQPPKQDESSIVDPGFQNTDDIPFP